MTLLKKEHWFLYTFLTFLFPGILTFVIASDLHLYEKDAWYTKWYNWALGIVLGIYPALIMVIVLNISLQIKLCKLLKVKGEVYYGYPYLWILSLIIPFIGWATFIVLMIHVYFSPAILIHEGEAEKLCQV